MVRSTLNELLPGAPQALCHLLDARRGCVQPPIRAEIFGTQRFQLHGRLLGRSHRAATVSIHAATFFPRLKNNIQTLREAHQYLGEQANTGYDISPAAEWLLDNFHTIEAIFGLEMGSTELRFKPCLPSHWKRAEMTLVRGAYNRHFILMRANLTDALNATSETGAQALLPGQSLRWIDLTKQSCFVIPMATDSVR